MQKIQKILKYKIVRLLLGVLVLLIIYSAFLGIRNRRYTKNLPDYPLFYYNDGDNYYTERKEKIIIELVRLFDIFHPALGVQMTLKDVYWEEEDDYVDITLSVKESLAGEIFYTLGFSSKPEKKAFPGVTLADGEDDFYVTFIHKGKFLIDEHMNSLYNTGFVEDKENQEYKDFVYQNEEALTQLAEYANDYWNLGLEYNPD